MIREFIYAIYFFILWQEIGICVKSWKSNATITCKEIGTVVVLLLIALDPESRVYIENNVCTAVASCLGAHQSIILEFISRTSGENAR